MTYLCCPSLKAQCESEGSGSVRAQGESAGRARQQVTAYTGTRRASRCSFDMENEPRFCRQLLSQQARWAAQSSFIYLTRCFNVKQTLRFFFSFCTICLTGFSHRNLGLFGSRLFHRQYHSPLRQACSELQFLPGKKLTLYKLSGIKAPFRHALLSIYLKAPELFWPHAWVKSQNTILQFIQVQYICSVYALRYVA